MLSVTHAKLENMVTMTIPPPTSRSQNSPISIPNIETEVTMTLSVSDKNQGGQGGNNNSQKKHKLSSRFVNDRGSIERMQKLLLLLRHASKCTHGNEGTYVSTTDEQNKLKQHSCALYSHCRSIKKLWKHITECGHNAGSRRSCDFPNCNRSRYALWHYKNCSEGNLCIVCGPVRMLMAKESETIQSEKAKSRAVLLHMEGRETSTKRQHSESEHESDQEVPTETNLSDLQQLRQKCSRKRQKMECNVGDEVVSESPCLDEATKEKCDKLIKGLLNHKHGWVFSSPVDPVMLNIPDYFEVIKEPMDLGTIEERLQSGSYYKTVKEIRADVMLTFDNAITYNMTGTEVHTMALEMKNQFLADWERLLR